MNEQAVRQALRAMSPRMPGADIGSLVAPVTRAWNDHRRGGRLMATVAVIVDAAWPPGYAAGVAHGHRFVTDFLVRTAQRQLADAGRLDEQGRRLSHAVLAGASVISGSVVTVANTGPSRYEYLTAMGDANGDTEAERAAIAARVGWTHGYRTGDADAAWSAAGRTLSVVKDLVGTHTIRQVTIDGMRGDDWLAQLDVTSREASAHDAIHPRSVPAQAFVPLRQVGSATTNSARTVPDAAAAQHRPGRHR